MEGLDQWLESQASGTEVYDYEPEFEAELSAEDEELLQFCETENI